MFLSFKSYLWYFLSWNNNEMFSLTQSKLYISKFLGPIKVIKKDLNNGWLSTWSVDEEVHQLKLTTIITEWGGVCCSRNLNNLNGMFYGYTPPTLYQKVKIFFKEADGSLEEKVKSSLCPCMTLNISKHSRRGVSYSGPQNDSFISKNCIWKN